MFDPNLTLEAKVLLALDRAQQYYLDPDIDRTKLKHLPGVEACCYSGIEQFNQVELFNDATCPVCVKVIADTLQIELNDRYASS